MRRRWAMAAVCGLVFVVASASAKPMPASVTSWQGEFVLRETGVPIQIAKFPVIRLWIYELKTGSKGTAIGFSDKQGEMLLAPQPRDKGFQPIYRDHTALPRNDGKADLFVTYNVHGEGGLQVIERYTYDGKSIVLVSTAEKPAQRELHDQDK